jgi:diaminopropionate ammonia-lyase
VDQFSWGGSVEPTAAACLQASHEAGKPSRGEGLDSAMGRLDCKEPSIVAWDVLERCDVSYLSLSEEEGQSAANELSALGLATTPSGAAGYAGLMQQISRDSAARQMRPLVIVSEGPA